MIWPQRANGQLILHSILVAVILIGVWVGQLIANEVLGVKHIIAFVAGLSVIVLAVSLNPRYMKALLGLAIFSFVFGHRSVYIARWTYFVPSEIIFWTLFVLLLSKGVIQRRMSSPRLPGSLLILVGLTLLGFFATPDLGSNWDGVLSAVKVWLLALPVFVIARELIVNVGDIRRAQTLLVVVGVTVASLAVVEYFVPSVANAMPWFFNAEQTYLVTDDGFVRAGFTFFGNPIGVILVVWAVLILMHRLLGSMTVPGNRWLSLVGVAIGLLAIYISGARGAWLAFILGIALLVAGSGFRVWILLIVLVAILMVLPEATWRPMRAVGNRLSAYSDTSVTWRIEHWQVAVGVIAANPLLGIGFRDNTLMHNAFLSFAKHLGLPGLTAFATLVGVIWVRLLRLLHKTQAPAQHRQLQLFISLMATWLSLASTHAVLGVPEVTVPFWFLLALCWRVPAVLHPHTHEFAEFADFSLSRKRVKWMPSVILKG